MDRRSFFRLLAGSAMASPETAKVLVRHGRGPAGDEYVAAFERYHADQLHRYAAIQTVSRECFSAQWPGPTAAHWAQLDQVRAAERPAIEHKAYIQS